MSKHRSNSDFFGYLLLDKSPGQTSFTSLGLIKKALDTDKVGHTGTLDKFASGLLIILVGRAVKLSPWVIHCDKTYEGTIRFGAETDTLDPEGSVVAEAPVPSREQVSQALAQFRGEISQVPPEYSAIHVDGRRASELARSGEAPEMKKRPVTIYDLELSSWEPPLAGVHVRCSSGTYIRSLARDIARACASRAHLVSLRRTQVAGFFVADALRISAGGDDGAEAIRDGLRPIDRGLFEALGIPRFDAGEDIRSPMIHGRPLEPLLSGLAVQGAQAGAAAVFAGETFAGMVEREGGGWTYGYVYAGH
ncbi:MAG: tRNA pseudouridine(55) synthase TruB [Treponema sp.]|jgi:tRNA pseudouridine55 synthase|nr:tRNA pseudouridine(55) synthase TruB [Treponema sp.]